MSKKIQFNELDLQELDLLEFNENVHIYAVRGEKDRERNKERGRKRVCVREREKKSCGNYSILLGICPLHIKCFLV